MLSFICYYGTITIIHTFIRVKRFIINYCYWINLPEKNQIADATEDNYVRKKETYTRTREVEQDHLVTVFKAFQLKKQVRPLRTPEEAVEDYIIQHHPESVSEIQMININLRRELKKIDKVFDGSSLANKIRL